RTDSRNAIATGTSRTMSAARATSSAHGTLAWAASFSPTKKLPNPSAAASA
ncbi:MAG: hypothetical protein QOJ68_3310, partial [Blastococcus sp.]|nr:hypothetical protein [Blastococcus sp.]